MDMLSFTVHDFYSHTSIQWFVSKGSFPATMWRICPSFLSRHNIPRSSQFSRHNVPCSSQISRHHVPLFEVMGCIGYKSYCSAFQQFARIGLHEQCIFIRPTMLWLLFIVIQQLMLRLSQQTCYAWVMFGKGKVVEFWAFSLRLCSIAFMQVSHLNFQI